MQVPENGRAMMNGCPDVTARFSLDPLKNRVKREAFLRDQEFLTNLGERFHLLMQIIAIFRIRSHVTVNYGTKC